MTVHTSAPELAFKPHPVEAREHARALELPPDELALVPADGRKRGNHGDAAGGGRGTHLEPSGKVSTPQPPNRPFSNCPLKQVPSPKVS